MSLPIKYKTENNKLEKYFLQPKYSFRYSQIKNIPGNIIFTRRLQTPIN